MAYPPLPLLNEVELQELINEEIAKIEVVRRDLTRKYHEQIAEQEVGFRQRLYQLYLHTPSSQHEVLQAKLNKKLQQESSRSFDLGFPEQPGCSRSICCNNEKDLKKHISEKKHQSKSKLKMSKQDSEFLEQPGWCSLCEAVCGGEKDLEKHILGKKHQLKLKNLKQDSGFREQPGWCSLNKVECKSEKDLKKHTWGKKHQYKLKILKQDLGFPEQPGCCLLCEVVCSSGKDLESHISGKKHRSKLKMLKQDSRLPDQPEQPRWCSLCEFECKSKKILQDHFFGKKHQSNLKLLKQDSGIFEQPGWCSLCKVHYNSETVLEEHVSGKKHQSKLKMLKQESGEGNSRQLKPQAKHEQQESDIVGNLDKREEQMEEGGIRISFKEHKISLNSSQLTVKECEICNDVFSCEADFESHLAGREHEMQLKKTENSETLSDVDHDSTKCAISDGKEMINIECGLLGVDNDNVEKRVENKLAWKINADMDVHIGAENDKIDMKENAELDEQYQINEGGIPSEICEMSSNLCQISEECANADGRELGIPDNGDEIVADKIVLDFKDNGDLHNRRTVKWKISPCQQCVVL